MTFLEKKKTTIDLETLNINASYLVQVLKQVNAAKTEEVTPELTQSVTVLFDDTTKTLSDLRAVFVPPAQMPSVQKSA